MPQQDVRVGLIGAGRMGADHVTRIHERISGAHLTRIGDPDVERAKQAAAHTEADVTDDPHAVIASADVDAVVITSPGPTHEALLFAALDRGIPVFCEKPLTPDAESALRIVLAEQDTGRQLIQLGFMRRFDPQYRQLRALLRSTELGDPLVLHCTHRNAAAPPGFTNEMLISDSVVHEFDTIRWLLASEISTVSVRRPQRSSRHAGGLSDPQLISIETAHGALAEVEIFVNCGFGYQVRCEAVCESGTARVGDDAGLVHHHENRWGGIVTSDFRDRFAQAFNSELQSWVDAARHGTVAAGAATAWDGYAAAACSAAGVQAQGSGQRTPITLQDHPALHS